MWYLYNEEVMYLTESRNQEVANSKKKRIELGNIRAVSRKQMET